MDVRSVQGFAQLNWELSRVEIVPLPRSDCTAFQRHHSFPNPIVEILVPQSTHLLETMQFIFLGI